MVGDLVSELRCQVNDQVDLSQTIRWIPDFAEVDSYRLYAESAATIYLNHGRNIYFKGGLKHDYDNYPASGVKHLDMYYFTNLGFKF